MYLTLREVAELLRQDPETVRRKFAEKKIPGAFKTDGDLGDWRISREDFERWVKARAVNG